MMKKIICVLLLLPFIVKAQYFAGDKLPDIQLGKLLYEKNHPVKLSDYAGKFLVLDIMSLYCKSCIDALPKYDSMQAVLGNNSQVLILVNDTKQKAENFLRKSGLNKLTHLHFMALDEETKNSFNILSNPFHVWVGRDHVIKAIAHSEYLTVENIHKLSTSGDIPAWPDISVPPDEPLIDVSNINHKSLKTYYTLVQPYRNGLPQTQKFHIDSLRGFQQWSLYNSSIINLYKTAVKGLTKEDLSGLRWELVVKDSSRFFQDKKTTYKAAWQRKNHFVMEYILPLSTSSVQRHQKLLTDLNFYFGLNGRMEKKEMVCRVIRRANNGNVSPMEMNDRKETTITLKELLHRINVDGRLGIFIRDETLDDQVKLKVSSSQLKSLESIEQLLNLHQLQWEETKKEITVFVLADQ